ncbi:MarR family transcriptional regulator [Oceanospirillaceae bacterium]|jgi:DNA-binding MarR family transcriptional regulator|nr:MarR family transcriptional regulator [Oceanospirillaceae bacterium]
MDKETRSVYFTFFNEVGIIAQLSRALMEARLPTGITVPHFSVLNHLTRVHDGRTPLALARAFQVPKTTMTHTLSGLETQGFIELRRNPKDGRSKYVWMTQKGRDFHKEAIALLDPDIIEISMLIPEEQIQSLIPRLIKIREKLDAYRDASD